MPTNRSYVRENDKYKLDDYVARSFKVSRSVYLDAGEK